jgi:beta-galactosidase
LVVKGERFEAVFSKKEGTLSAYTLNNVPLMSKGLELNLFRAPTDNDKQVSGDWQRKGLYQLQTETGKWETRQEEDRITLHIRNCHKGKLGFEYRTEIEYTVNADGSIMVKTASKRSPFTTYASAVSFRLMFPFSGTNIGFSLLDSLNCSVATS